MCSSVVHGDRSVAGVNGKVWYVQPALSRLSSEYKGTMLNSLQFIRLWKLTWAVAAGSLCTALLLFLYTGINAEQTLNCLNKLHSPCNISLSLEKQVEMFSPPFLSFLPPALRLSHYCGLLVSCTSVFRLSLESTPVTADLSPNRCPCSLE